MASNETYVRNQLYNINLADLQPDPNQPRKFLDSTALEELTASIRQHGVLEPILFRQENGLLYIVAGERRVAAARKAGLTTIPAIFLEGQDHGEISLVENLLRQDLTPVEEAEAFDRLMKDHKYKQEDLARFMGKSVPTISVTLSLNKLPQEIRDECRKDPSVSKRTLIDIASKRRVESMIKAYQRYKAKINPQKKTRTASTTTKYESTFIAIDTAANRITDLDIETLTPEGRQEYIAALKDLQKVISAVLVMATQANSEEVDGPQTDLPAEPKPGK